MFSEGIPSDFFIFSRSPKQKNFTYSSIYDIMTISEKERVITMKTVRILALCLCLVLLWGCQSPVTPPATITPTTAPTEPTVTEPDPVAAWYTGTETAPLRYEEYFSGTRYYSYDNFSTTLTWTGTDKNSYSLSAAEGEKLCIIDENQQLLWTVPETQIPDGIQWLICDGRWAYGINTTDILRLELQTGKTETLFSGEKLLCGDNGHKAANLMVYNQTVMLFAAVRDGKGCIFRLYLPTMTLDTLCDEIPGDTLPCWLEIWTPENNRHYPFMFLNPQLQPILYDTLADSNSPYKKVIEGWPDSAEEPMIVDLSEAWEIPDLMTTLKFHSPVEWLIISLQSDNELPGSVLWVYDQQENAIIQKTNMLHTGNHGVMSIQSYPSAYPDIRLGMTPEELLTQLGSSGFTLEMPDYDEYVFPEEVTDPVKDGRTYNLTDLSFSYHTPYGRQTFTFSFDGKLRSFSSWDEELPTAEGLKAGDSLRQMQQLYGTDLQKDVDDYPVYQYRIDGGYLNVFYENDRVKGWCISTYPNINND